MTPKPAVHWPQRETFKSRVEGYMRENHISRSDFAELMGIADGTLRNYFYLPTHRPSLDKMQNAARVIGCSVTEFIDDPAETVDGVTGIEDAKHPEDVRVALRRIKSDLDAMSPESINEVMKAWDFFARPFRGK